MGLVAGAAVLKTIKATPFVRFKAGGIVLEDAAQAGLQGFWRFILRGVIFFQ